MKELNSLKDSWGSNVLNVDLQMTEHFDTLSLKETQCIDGGEYLNIKELI